MKGVLKKTASVLLSASLLTGSWIGSVPANAEETEEKIQQEFYVSVTGSDSGDGSKENPFATVERARQAVDEVNDNMTGNIIVNIGAGDYYLDETIQFGPSDSGTNGYEVIYRSSDGIGEANLIGGEKISGWEPVDQTDVTEYDLDESLLGKVYKVQLDPEQYEFNTLYVNDERATMARTRNRDNNPYFPMAKGEYMRSVGGHNNDLNMLYKAGDIDEKAIAGMVHAQERGEEEIAQVFVWDGGDWDWFTNTIPIATIDTSKNEFKFPTPPEDYPEKYRTKYNIGSGARYFLQGNLAFMDVEGEYHYNKTTGILYYYPKGEDGAIEDQTVVVPTMQKAIYFKGAEKENLADEPDPNQQVHNITLDGLAVKDTEFADYFTYSWNFGDAGAGIGYFPKAAEGSTNPSFCETTDREEFRVGSITLTGTNHITITNTRVKNSGLYGIIYAGDNQYNTLKNSVIEDTGYGGLIFDGGYPAVGKYNNHNTVENVLIHEVGDLVGHAVGMTVMSSGQNTFTNMEIFDTPKRALLVIGGYRRDRNGGDKNYDEIKDMYTVGNHFQYIHVHDAQQDAGEDSAVFLSWLLSGKDVKALHGSNDPNNLTTNLEGIDTSIDRYNYFDQMLITDVGADPSVIEKCTVGGLDTAMGATGSQFTNIRAANTQHHLLAIRDRDGGGYGDMYYMENCTNNLYTDDLLKSFDDSKMEYDKIGLTGTFPEEYRVSKREYSEAPDDLYFGDDFEASRQLDLRKWTVEKGEVEMHVGYGYMSEDPHTGRRSLPINADLNPNGVVVSRTFENDLNKIVEVKYMDRRKDYANNDRVDAVPTEILPNSFLRVDDGENALGLGAVGTVSKDYYQIKKGDELIQTNIKRCFGWHTFKFDYSSGTDVKLYIDDQLVATYDESDGVSTSFNYIGMGDWEGKGGKAFFDQLYVYGGKEAPPVEDLPLPTPPEAPDADLFTEDFESETSAEFIAQKENAQIEVTAAPDNEDNRVLHVSTADDTVYFADGMDWSNYTFECKIWIDNWDVSGTPQPWDNMAPIWNATQENGKNIFKRYSLKYRRDSKDFALYKRNNGDTDMVSATAPAEYEGKWHDYKISTVDGLITAYIDGEKIFEYKDSTHTRGTIGFDGINVEYYVDDIKVTGQKTADPTANLDSGTYPEIIQVELIAAGNGHKIFYTLDGSDPSDPAHGQYYIPESTITIDKTSTLKFVAISDGSLYSNVIEREYIIDDNYTAEDALNEITIESPAPKQTKLVLPERAGFTFEIVASSNEAIGIDGVIHPESKDVEVTLTIRATRLTDNTTAEKDFTVTVPGIGKNLNEVIEADRIDAVNGSHIYVKDNEVFNFNGGDWIRYDYVDFGETPKNVRFHIDTAIHPSYAGKKIHVMLDDPTDGVNLGTVVVESHGDWGVYGEQTIDLTEAVSGVHTIYLVGEGGEGVSGIKTVMFEDITPVETSYQVTVENGEGSGEYEAGAEVTITADKAPEGKVFDKWVSEDVTFTDAESETTTFVMPEKDVTVTATYREAANKSLLQNTYDYALTLSTEGVTDSAKAYFEKVLGEAKAVLDDPKATQEEVNTAWDNLLEGIWGLGLVQGNKTMLEQLIARADEMMANADKYVQDHWQELVDALEAAKKVMADGDAMKEDVEAAADALLNAIVAQRYKANKSNLEDLINKANGMDLSQYTAESVAVFKAALANANLVLADESLSEDDQNVVDSAVKELDAAIKNLSAAEETPSNPDDPDDGEETPSNPDKGNPDKGEEGTQTPATGDHSDTAILFTAVFAVMMLAALAIIWRKKENQM